MFKLYLCSEINWFFFSFSILFDHDPFLRKIISALLEEDNLIEEREAQMLSPHSNRKPSSKVFFFP